MTHTRSREASPALDPWLSAQRELERARNIIAKLAADTHDPGLAIVARGVAEMAARISEVV